MFDNLLRYRMHLSIILILVLFAGSFFVPIWANAIALAVVLLSLIIALYYVVSKHIRINQGKPTNKIRMTRNILLELTGILIAMLLAGLAGRYGAEALTHQIGDKWMKLTVGILIGLLTGLGVGIVFRRAWGRFIGIFVDNLSPRI